MRRSLDITAASDLVATMRATWASVLPRPAQGRMLGLDARHVGHVELDRLGRYIGVFALAGACLLINVWSRIDLRQTSVELHRTRAEFEVARSDNARLQLELAALTDPSRLVAAATELGLDSTVPVIELP